MPDEKDINNQQIDRKIPVNVIGLHAGVVCATSMSGDVALSQPSTLYVGVMGNLNVVTEGGETVLFQNVVGFFPILVTKVLQSTTTAQAINYQY